MTNTPPSTATIITTPFDGRVIMIGCGSIGQALLPVLGRHLENIYPRTTVLSADESGRSVAQRCGAQ